MKKTLLFILLIVLTTTITAEPKDNFKKSSLFLGGNINGYSNSSNIFNEDIENKSTISFTELTSYIGIFLVNNLSLQPFVSFATYNYSSKSYDTTDDLYKNNESGNKAIGAGLSIDYYFTFFDSVIPYFGLGGYFSSIYYSDLILRDEVFMSGYNEFYVTAIAESGVLYFLNDNIALDLGVDVNFITSRVLTDADGETYVYEENYDHNEWIDMIINYTLGISYFLPSNPKLKAMNM